MENMAARLLLVYLLLDISSAKLVHHKASELHRSTHERSLENVVPKNYDPLERPSTTAPTTVFLSVHLTHIEWNFDRLNVVMYLRQKWTDSRLKRRKPSSVMCKPADLQHHLWFPDIYFANMIDETRVLNPGFVRVAPDGEIVHSTLVRSSFACPPYAPSKRLMAKNGEIDCEIALESYGHTAGEIGLAWMNDQPAATVDDAYNDMVKAIGAGEMSMSLAKRQFGRLTLNLTLDTGLSGDQLDFALRRFYGR